jgi:hypothetical protein
MNPLSKARTRQSPRRRGVRRNYAVDAVEKALLTLPGVNAAHPARRPTTMIAVNVKGLAIATVQVVTNCKALNHAQESGLDRHG